MKEKRYPFTMGLFATFAAFCLALLPPPAGADDDDQFTPADVEHETFRLREAGLPIPGERDVGSPRVFLPCPVQTALLPTSDRVAAWGLAL